MTSPPITSDVAKIAEAVSAPLTKLIESVEKGVGALYEPTGIVRKAKAEAKASLILAAAEEERELLKRAFHRFAFVECRRQTNIESIAEEAKHHLPDEVSPEPVSEDWMAKFFDNCKDVGEKELQRLWARLLAGEVAQPRTFSRRTMETLRTFSADDARVFSVFCDYAFSDKTNKANLVFVGIGPYGGFPGTTVIDVENHLISLGLLNAESEPVPYQSEDWHIDYCGQEYVIPHDFWVTLRLLANRESKIEIRRFTVVGNELAKIVSRTANPNFIESLKVAVSNHQIQLLTSEEDRQRKEQIERNRRNRG